MLWQVNQRILHWCILLLLALTIASLYVTTSLDTLRAAYYYIASMVLQKVGLAQHVFHINWHETTLRINTFGVLSEPYFTNQLHLFWYHLKLSFYYALSMTTVVTIGLTFWLIKRGKQQAESDFVRGSRLHKVNVVAKMVKSHGAADIVIGSLPMAKDFEVRHTLIHGTTGSGKGQTFNQFIEQIRRRGDRSRSTVQQRRTERGEVSERLKERGKESVFGATHPGFDESAGKPIVRGSEAEGFRRR